MDRETILIISIIIMFFTNIWQFFEYKRQVKLNKLANGFQKLADYAVIGFCASIFKKFSEEKPNDKDLAKSHEIVQNYFEKMSKELEEEAEEI